MDKLGILFLHHKNDDITRHNYNSVLKNNPSIKIIPIKDTNRIGLEKAYSPLNMKINRGDLYWNCDSLIYNWAIDNKEVMDCEYYLILEYDTLCDCNFLHVLDKYFSYDICGSELVESSDVNWCHFNKKTKDKFKDYIFGIKPFSGILIKKQALLSISEKVLQLQNENIIFETNNECRIGTLSKICNLNIGKYDIILSEEISCFNPKFKSKGLFYHPVKEKVEFL